MCLSFTVGFYWDQSEMYHLVLYVVNEEHFSGREKFSLYIRLVAVYLLILTYLIFVPSVNLLTSETDGTQLTQLQLH